MLIPTAQTKGMEMNQMDFSTTSVSDIALSRFRCIACGRSIRSSRALTLGRQVRCPSCGVKTRVLVESPDRESIEPVGSEKILPTGRSGIGPTVTPMPSPTPSQKAAANYPTIRGYTILGEIGRGAAGIVYRARHDALKRVVAREGIRAGGPRRPGHLPAVAVVFPVKLGVCGLEAVASLREARGRDEVGSYHLARRPRSGLKRTGLVVWEREPLTSSSASAIRTVPPVRPSP